MAPGVPVHTARVEAPEPRHFAFLLMGESNMVGCGRLEEGVDDKEHVCARTCAWRTLGNVWWVHTATFTTEV